MSELRPAAAVNQGVRCQRFTGFVTGVALVLVLFSAGAFPQKAFPQTANKPNISRQINLPAGSLSEALDTLVALMGVQIMYEPSLTDGVHVQPLNGMLTFQSALERLLANTGLKADQVNEKTVVLRRSQTRRSEANSSYQMKVAEVMTDNADSRNPSTTPDGAAANGASDALQEILVTATKRQERLQDVPASIAVMTAEDIDRRGLVSAEDYLRGIPGVNQATATLGQSIIIRGIETTPNAQNFDSGTTVATYFGETPTSNSAGLGGGTNVDLKLVDIERVEVLRGPQGTAFGNASLGGAVRTIPVTPKLDRFEGKVTAGYSVTSESGGGNNVVQAVGNLPLIQDRFAIRAVAYRFDDSGVYRNTAGSDPGFQAAAAQFGAQSFAANQDDIGADQFTGGRISALFQASPRLRLSLSYLTQKTEVDGQAFASTGRYTQSMLQVAPQHVVRGQKAGVFDTDIDISNATLEYDGTWADLLATFSYLESGSIYAAPLAAYAAGFPATRPLSDSGKSDHREHSGEIRLTTQFTGAWNFLVGIYGESIDDHFDETFYWFGTPATSPFGPSPDLGAYVDTRNLKQKAAFGEVSWKFLSGFTLTGGARAYDYERTGRVDNGIFSGGVVTTSLTQSDASGTTFRGNLSYEFNPNALVYAGWSQGFRLGRPQPGLPAGACDLDSDGIVDGTNVGISQTRALESDEVDNYELGAKFTLLDHRLRIGADIFRIDWTGVPVRIIVPGPPLGCGQSYSANAGQARSEGVEFQAEFQVTKAFRVDMGASKVRARLSEDAPGLLPPAFRDDRLPGSPSVNATLGLHYEFTVGKHEAFVRADSTYVGAFYGNFQETLPTRAGDYLTLDATARISIKNLTADLFVRNLTDADAYTFRGITAREEFFGYRLRPRTVGLQLSYRF